MKTHYMVNGQSVCGKPCKQVNGIPTDVDILNLEVMAGLTRCGACLKWIGNSTSEKTSVYLGEEIRKE